MSPYTQALQAAIASQITALRSEIEAAATSPKTVPDTTRGRAAPSEAAEEIIAALDQRISRLDHIRGWIEEDHELANLIDKVIGQQVESAMPQQRRFNVVLNVRLLIAGWLLSLLATPDNIFHFFHP